MDFHYMAGKVFTSALNLTFSPGEKEQLLFISVLSNDCPTNPVAGFSMRRRTIPPLLGGEGRGEDGRSN
jgi:hypothetical protein